MTDCFTRRRTKDTYIDLMKRNDEMPLGMKNLSCNVKTNAILANKNSNNPPGSCYKSCYRQEQNQNQVNSKSQNGNQTKNIQANIQATTITNQKKIIRTTIKRV